MMVISCDMTSYNRPLAALIISVVIVLTVSVEPTRANLDILDSLKRVLPDPVSRLVQSWQISDVIYNNVKKSQANKALGYDGETIKATDFRPLVPNEGNKRKQFSRNGGGNSKRRKTNEKVIKIGGQLYHKKDTQNSSVTNVPGTTELYQSPSVTEPKRRSKEPQRNIKANMVDRKSPEPEETTKSPREIPTTTAVSDDGFMTTEAYDVTTERIEDWQDMMLRMNNEEENADDIWDRIRREATGGSTVSPPVPDRKKREANIWDRIRREATGGSTISPFLKTDD